MKYARTTGLLGIIVLLSVAVVCKADFTYTDFQSTAGLNLAGSATQNGNQIMMNPSIPSQKGAVWKQDLQSVGGGFSTTFTFQGNNQGGALDVAHHPGVDIISFVVQNAANNIATIGPYDPVTYPRVRIRYDGYMDAGIDPSSSSVKIIVNGVELEVVDVESLGIKFREGVHSSTIIYAEQTLKVLVDNQEIINMQNFDLYGLGLGTSYVGFESGTGTGAWAEHDLLSWSYQSVPEPATLLLLGIGGVVLRRRRSN